MLFFAEKMDEITFFLNYYFHLKTKVNETRLATHSSLHTFDKNEKIILNQSDYFSFAFFQIHFT